MRLALLLVALTASCLAPSNPQDGHRHQIAFGAPLDSAGPWRPDQLAELQREVAALEAIGTHFVIVSEGDADVILRPFVSGDARCQRGVGRWFRGSRTVECDPACAPGYEALRTCAGHEILHTLGLHHVCTRAGEAADCDTSVGFGYALMNPSIAYDTVESGDGLPVAVSQSEPTYLDLAEWRAVHPR